MLYASRRTALDFAILTLGQDTVQPGDQCWSKPYEIEGVPYS
jgi:hypothetical protein